MPNLRPTLLALPLLLGGCSGMTQEECVSKYKVYSAGTQRAIRLGYAACTATVAGDSTVANDFKAQCILDGVGDVKTDQGLRLLASSCRR